MKLTKHKHYNRLEGMRERCYGVESPSYKNYGGRGIVICNEWKSNPRRFLEWCDSTYEEGKTLDRIDNNGPYSPENCRWATREQQMTNSRITEELLNSIKNAKEKALDAFKEKYENPKTREEKYCPECEEFLPLLNFYKVKTSSDGYYSYCRICTGLRRKK